MLGVEFVTLYVGPKRRQFVVHKKLLCDRAAFFHKAFQSGFKEGIDGVMHLLEEDPDSVEYLIDFLYRRVIPDATADPNMPWNFLELYYLAENICLSDLMDQLVDGFQTYHKKENCCWDLEVSQEIY